MGHLRFPRRTVGVALLLVAGSVAMFASELHTAARAGDVERVKALLAQGVPVSAPDTLGGTALHDAAWSGHRDVVLALLEAGADVNARHVEGGSTPLHYAVITNRKDLVDLLLAKGADLRAKDRAGATVLHLAANRGYEELFVDLLGRFGEVDVADSAGATPLDEACWRGQAGIVKILLARGANAKRTQPKTGLQPLHVAAQKGASEVVSLLLAAGADGNAPDKDGERAMDVALRMRFVAVADALLAGGATLTDPQKRLGVAVTSGHAEMIGWLLKHGARVGPTMLHDAALKGHLESMQVLLENGADVKALNPDGATALHDAALGGHTGAASLLLGRGAEIDARDGAHGATPLFLAASWGRKQMVDFLLEKGAGKLLRNKQGKSAREAALENSHADVAEALR
jgi:cytohesin